MREQILLLKEIALICMKKPTSSQSVVVAPAQAARKASKLPYQGRMKTEPKAKQKQQRKWAWRGMAEAPVLADHMHPKVPLRSLLQLRKTEHPPQA